MPDATTKKTYSYFRATEVYDGKRYEAKGKTQREADKKLAKKIEAAQRGELGVNRNTKVSAWIDTWLKDYIQPRVREPGANKMPNTMSPNSYRTYDYVTRLYIKPAIGNKRLVDVNEADLRAILNSQRGKSYGHVQKLKVVIKAMFDQAYLSRLITFNPAYKMELPAVVKGTRRSLTEDERVIFFKAAQESAHGVLFRFLLATGLRPNEVRALRVRHLDLDKAIVRVEEAVESGTHIITMPKTEAGIRHTVINDADLIVWLREYIKGKSPDDFLFAQRRDGTKMITDSAIHAYWRSFARRMDLLMGAEHDSHGHIYDPSDLKADGTPLYPDPDDPKKPRNGHKIAPDLTLYCLRHTFCTDMQRKGVPVEVTKYLMGHEDISTTSNIYTDSGEPEAIRATEFLFPKK